MLKNNTVMKGNNMSKIGSMLLVCATLALSACSATNGTDGSSARTVAAEPTMNKM